MWGVREAKKLHQDWDNGSSHGTAVVCSRPQQSVGAGWGAAREECLGRDNWKQV